MKEIDLKHTTKKELYKMLRDLDEIARKQAEHVATLTCNYERLEADCAKRADDLNDALADAIEAKNKLSDEIIRLNVERQTLRTDLEDAKREASVNEVSVSHYRELYRGSEEKLDEARRHPFKFIWSSIK